MRDECPQLAGLGARRAGEVDAVGRDGLEQQPLRAQARRASPGCRAAPCGSSTASSAVRGSGGRRARARAGARSCAGTRRAASGRPRTPFRAARCGARPARARGASDCSTQRRSAGLAVPPGARPQHEHGRQRPRRVARQRHLRPRLDEPGGGSARRRLGRDARRRGRTRVRFDACGRGLAGLRREPATFTCRATARTSARTLTASRRTRRVVISLAIVVTRQIGLPRQGEQGRCMLLDGAPGRRPGA